MLAVYKRELKAYLTSMIGYIFMAFIIFMTGIYFTAYNLTYGYSQFGYVLAADVFVFLIIVPILTMKIFAEEKKQKTDQILFTAPVKLYKIVLGKYFAVLTIFAIPVALFCFYPIVLSQFGTVSFKMAYVSLFGFLLLGAAYLAIGMFISTVTDNQVIAAILCFAVLLVSYLVSGISTLISTSSLATFIAITIAVLIVCAVIYVHAKNFLFAAVFGMIAEIALTVVYVVKSTLLEDKISTILSALDVAAKFDNFVSGIFDITSIVYFVSVIFLFIFFTIQLLQKRRYS